MTFPSSRSLTVGAVSGTEQSKHGDAFDPTSGQAQLQIQVLEAAPQCPLPNVLRVPHTGDTRLMRKAASEDHTGA